MATLDQGTDPGEKTPLNYIVRHSRCASCKREALLASYENRGPIRLGKIPLLPRSPRRVIDACPLCNNATVMTMKSWNAQCQAARLELGRTLEDNEIDIKKIRERVKAVAQLADHQGIAEFAEKLRDCRIHTQESLLFMARTCDGFQQFPLAEELYRLALVDTPTDVLLKEKLANALLRQNKTEGIEELLRHVVERLEEDKIHLLYDWARVLAKNGDQDQALWVLDVSESVSPDMVRKREYQDLRAAVEANEAPPEPAKLPSLAPAEPTAMRVVPRKRMDPVMIAVFAGVPALGALAIGAYVGVSLYLANERQIILINGLQGSYTVSINGASSTTLRPGEPVSVNVREGYLRLTAESPEYDLEDLTLSIRTDFWTRPIFFNQFFVVNPDGAAILRNSQIVYANEQRSSSTRSIPDPSHEILLGNTTYHFTKVDYPFVESPPTVDMHPATNYVKRSELLLAHPADVWYYLPGNNNDIGLQLRQAMGDHLRQRLRHEPHTLESARDIVNFIDLNSLRRIFEPFLEKRPVEVGIHRLWQDQAYRVGSSDIEDQYAALSAQDPDNAVLKYLHGRVARDLSTAGRLYQEAAEASQPCHDAWYDLALWNLSTGRMSVANQFANRVLQSPNPPQSAHVLIAEAAIASGNWRQAEEALRRNLNDPDFGVANMRRLAYVLARTDRADDITTEARRFFNSNSSRIHESSWNFVDRMEGIAYEVENPGRIWDGHMNENEYGHIAALLFHDRLSDAIDRAEIEGTTALDKALLYLVCKGTPRERRGEQFLGELSDHFDNHGGRDYRITAAMLRGDEQIQPEDLLML
ncbi:MAG: hypothetical protein JJU11_06545, partial [Candidatus Sumerlaeia bacterium]|nr:hypothetical protein [Candidatus Sumerlaeia bacterium]